MFYNNQSQSYHGGGYSQLPQVQGYPPPNSYQQPQSPPPGSCQNPQTFGGPPDFYGNPQVPNAVPPQPAYQYQGQQTPNGTPQGLYHTPIPPPGRSPNSSYQASQPPFNAPSQYPPQPNGQKSCRQDAPGPQNIYQQPSPMNQYPFYPQYPPENQGYQQPPPPPVQQPPVKEEKKGGAISSFIHSKKGKVMMGLGGTLLAGVIGAEVIGDMNDNDDSGEGGGWFGGDSGGNDNSGGSGGWFSGDSGGNGGDSSKDNGGGNAGGYDGSDCSSQDNSSGGYNGDDYGGNTGGGSPQYAGNNYSSGYGDGGYDNSQADAEAMMDAQAEINASTAAGFADMESAIF